MRRWKMTRLSIVLLVTSFTVPSAFCQWFQMYLDTYVIAHSQGAEASATAFFSPYGWVDTVTMTLFRDGEEVGSDWAGQSYSPCTVWIGDSGSYPPYTLYIAESEAWGEVPDYGWFWDSDVAFGSTPGPQVALYVEPGKQQYSSGFALLSGTPGLNTTGLSANGSPPGGSYEWTIGPKLQFDGSSMSQSTSVKGTSESQSPGDTWVQVSYNVYGYTESASIRFSILSPRRIERLHDGGAERTTVTFKNGVIIGYITQIPYKIKDQLWPPETIELAGIPTSETLWTVVANKPVEFDPPDGVPKLVPSNILGQFNDNLTVENETWPYLQGFVAERRQIFTLDGHLLGPEQRQYYFPTYALNLEPVMTW